MKVSQYPQASSMLNQYLVIIIFMKRRMPYHFTLWYNSKTVSFIHFDQQHNWNLMHNGDDVVSPVAFVIRIVLWRTFDMKPVHVILISIEMIAFPSILYYLCAMCVCVRVLVHFLMHIRKSEIEIRTNLIIYWYEIIREERGNSEIREDWY